MPSERPRRALLPTLATFGLAVGVVGALATPMACVSPDKDYQDFIDRSPSAASGEDAAPVDAGPPIDAKPPTEATTGIYAGICVTSLANRDPSQALRFYTETKFTPEGAGGKLTLIVTPLLGWDLGKDDYMSPATVTKSGPNATTRGDSFTVANVPVSATGRFTAVLGTITLTTEANSVSGRAAEIANTTLDGAFGAGDTFCSSLGGNLIKPYLFTFDPAKNTCLFTKVKDGDPLPVIPSEKFVCNTQ